MAIAGPRLDRPSAVGDEGRPRAASLTVAAVVVVGLAVVALARIGALGTLTLLGLSVTLTVAGMALSTRDGVGERVVGHLLYHPGAVFVVLLVMLAASSSRGILVGGLFVALLGVAATWTNVLAQDRLREATVAGATSYATSVGWVVVGVVAVWIASGTWALASSLLASTDPVDSLFGFLGFVAAAGLLVRAAIWALPVLELTRRSKRRARVVGLTRLGRAAAGTAIFAIALALLAGTIVGPAAIHRAATATPAVGAFLVGLTSPVPLLSVLAVCAVGAVGTVVGVAGERVASHVDEGNEEFLASVVAGFCLAVLVLGYLSVPVVGLVAVVPRLVGVALLAPLFLVTVAFLALAAMDAGFVPARAAGPATSAAGLVVAGIGSSLAGLSAPLTFACGAGAVVVWDVATFGLGLTVELGHRPDTRRLELYHAVLSLGLGFVAVVAVTGLDLARRSLGGHVGAWPAVGAAVFGAVVLAVVAARREP